ncbi:MAG: right-handed parallel beta-helix repeat-containing protein [Candidatus Bathyarchaeota archaeon]
MRHKKALLALVVTAILLSSSFLVIWTFLAEKNSLSPKFFVGVQLGYGGVDDYKALVDKVKDYTNLFVVSSSAVTRDEADLTEVCDYLYDAGLYFIVYFQTLSASYKFHVQNWAILAKEAYGDQFLGEYLFDEPGGKQLDQGMPTCVTSAEHYMEAATFYVKNVAEYLEDYIYLGGEEFTSDYGLYWFDYKAGYDTVLAQFGWNHSRQLHIALCRGAAKVQNRDWGVMVTWTYENPPYIESGEELYADLVLAYHNGAKYAVVFNHEKDVQYSGYGILTDEHFEALENFWKYKNDNSKKHGSLRGDVALVLPQDYGFGFRNPNDKVWGLWENDRYSPEIWNDVNDLLDEYGYRLDIVYSDPEFNDKLEDCYSEVFVWGIEDSSIFPVQNLNSSLGYLTIQEAINSGYTFGGHVISVKAGIYYENLVVNKSVALIGEDRKTTIIDGGNVGTAVTITGRESEWGINFVTGVNMTGFTIRNGNNPLGEVDQSISILAAGINLTNADHCNIVGNDITANGYGIYLKSSYNNRLRDNKIENNTSNFGIDGDYLSHFVNDIDSSNMINGKKVYYLVNGKNRVIDSSTFSDIGFLALVNCTDMTVQNLDLNGNGQGILLAYTTNSTIMNNSIANNYEGIRLVSSSNNVLRNNSMSNNTYNFWVKSGLVNDIDTSNMVNGKPVYYWVNQQDRVVPSDAGYVALVNCANILVQNLNVSNNRQGILLASTTNSTIMENHITENYYGIQLEGCTEINITGNNITNNGLGLHFYGSSYNTVAGNNIENNRASGIYLHRSNDNSINKNNLAKNEEGIQIDNRQTYIDPVNSNNQIVANNITENIYGIRIKGSENDNTFYHNNFINNTKQVHDEPSSSFPTDSPLGTWDNGVEGNYWSDYDGKDINHDGIGDTKYLIQTDTTLTTYMNGEYVSTNGGTVTIDRYPLNGMFSSFSTPAGHTFNVISNSTIENFQYFESNRTIKIRVSGEEHGFCRISIPHTSMNVNNISVAINNGLDSVLNPNYRLYDNGIQRWIYFAYPPHSQEIQITAGPP